MKRLAEIIRHEVREQGSISFARFMELALYYPELGYYERQSRAVGRRGDFFTSVSVGPVFGELLAFQFAQWLDELHATSSHTAAETMDEKQRPLGSSSAKVLLRGFQIVEAGAHDGRLAFDILSWFRERRSDLLGQIEYWIIEPSPALQRAQAQTLREFQEQVRWFLSWEMIASRSIRGVIFANELLDSFPVRRLGWNAREHRWFEWRVCCDGDSFAWTKFASPPACETMMLQPRHWDAVPRELTAVLPDGYTIEISPAAEVWWSQAAVRLGAGKLLTIDYGLLEEQRFSPERTNGTLRAYHRHHATSHVLERVGEQDITCHVNFGALRQKGEEAGLRDEGLIPQTNFLTGIVKQIEQSPQSFANWTPPRIRQLQTLTHPEHLGRAFQVLVQSRERSVVVT